VKQTIEARTLEGGLIEPHHDPIHATSVPAAGGEVF
jgi:hypothetical protein